MIDVAGVGRRFGDRRALDDVSLHVEAGEIHALLGPNGAGKTTLLRILCGLIDPTAGRVAIAGVPAPAARPLIGFVPPGERTFYMRLSALENLVFFARLYGVRHADARSRAMTLIERVDLADAANQRVGTFSQGMLKRLAFARALLVDPKVLLVDEATHDLDPAGARRIRDLARAAADDGAAVLWATQRIEEIRGFADAVTVLVAGRTRFAGTVPALLARGPATRYLVEVADGRRNRQAVVDALEKAVDGLASISPNGEPDGRHYVVALGEGTALGAVIAAITAARFQLIACREETSVVEEAFLALTEGDPR